MGEPSPVAADHRGPDVGIARAFRCAQRARTRRGCTCAGMGSPGRAASRVGWIRAGVAPSCPAGADRRSFVRRAPGAGPAAGRAPRAVVEPARCAVLGRLPSVAAGGSCHFGGLGTSCRLGSWGSVRSAADRCPLVGGSRGPVVGRAEDRGTRRSALAFMGSSARSASGMGGPRRVGSRGREALGGECTGCALERSGCSCLVGVRSGASRARRPT